MKTIATATMAASAAAVMSAVLAFAVQMPQEHKHAATAKAEPHSGMSAKCQAMMAEQQQVMTDVKAADQRLDDLIVKMNAASGMDKVAATATVVTELVTQRRTMQDGIAKMQHGMMGHMVEHMEAGKNSMAMCPMMKQMGDMKH